MTVFFVTGCAGFIGSRVAEMLLERGDEVVGVDNRNDAYDVVLKDWRLDRLQRFSRFRFFETDVADFEALSHVWKTGAAPYAAVYHLAARAGVRYSVTNPWVYLETNCRGTLNLLELCRASGVAKFVFASSSSVYGNVSSSGKSAFSEEMQTDAPCSPYAATKKAAESLAYSYHHLHGLDIAALRFFTVYGPAGRPDMSILRFVHGIYEGKPFRLYGDGTQSRDFTFIDDIARGVVAAAGVSGYKLLNLGGDHPFSVNTLIGMISEMIGKEPIFHRFPSHPADVDSTWADITRAKTLLGWQPVVPLREGLEKTVEWYRQNRDWAKEMKTLSDI
ncbi:MAG: SDR family NAD(P)-dependent oxidoreductase [Planctomycetia bacterium]|nr:SDR family NAD(P)-dependent oxidoreductase [Planctomycetia bacterium]